MIPSVSRAYSRHQCIRARQPSAARREGAGSRMLVAPGLGSGVVLGLGLGLGLGIAAARQPSAAHREVAGSQF